MTRVVTMMAVAILAACQGGVEPVVPSAAMPPDQAPVPNGSPVETPAPEQTPGETFRSLDALNAAQARGYLADVGRYVARRNLLPGELRQIEDEGGAAIRPIIERWTEEGGFQAMARAFVSEKLSTSGSRDGIDFSLPGNLAAVLAAGDRPWSDLVTADSCYDQDGGEIACDTGAPYTAGVLTTRAFLVGRNGRFNLNRANTLLGVFMCREYPVAQDLQPSLPKEMLISMFQASTPDEQADDRALNGFGNGFGCYSCHSQFSAHAQLFVKFDEAGVWIPDATGIEDPEGELGRSVDGLMASHFIDPERAASERTQMFDQEVQHLGEAAQLLAESEVFLPCASQSLIQYVFGLDPGRELAEDGVAATVEALQGTQPSLAALVVEIFSHPWVVYSVVESTPEESP